MQYENDLLKVSSLSETIESRLHENIAEYLNAEIANRTIRDIPGALDWLKSTFLYIRALKNPTHYHIPAATLASTFEMDKWLRTHVLLSHANKLVKNGMAYTDEEEYTLSPSQPGIIMAEHYMRLSTMSAICKLKSSASMEDLMWVIANSDELVTRAPYTLSRPAPDRTGWQTIKWWSSGLELVVLSSARRLQLMIETFFLSVRDDGILN